jgi:hypothetical protein
VGEQKLLPIIIFPIWYIERVTTQEELFS